jgi:hypothetical protein
MLEPEKYPNHMCGKYKLGGNIMEGFPCGGSMYEIMSMFEGYDDITFAAMELILEKGPDALMYQLNYDDIERVKMFPTICKKAIELGILTEEELAGWDDEEDEE